MTTYYNQIEDAQNALENRQRDYLKRFGWTETCNTPGAYWLWQRDFADVDARSREWWEATKKRVEAEGRRPPSEPRPYGVITAALDLAVSMTLSVLDQRQEDIDLEDLVEVDEETPDEPVQPVPGVYSSEQGK